MIEYTRLVAPREHLGLLIEPAAAQIRAALAAGQDDALARTLVLGRPLREWREGLRRRLELAGPVIVAGHQAEFFHAGVLAKLMAAHVLATGTNGTPLFLAVDSDVPKSPHLVVPEISAGGPRRVNVLIPAGDATRPLECQAGTPREHWLDFFVNVASIYEHYEASHVRTFADAWLAAGEASIDFCSGAAHGWTALTDALGLTGMRTVWMSALCEAAEFRAFAAHLVLHAPQLAHVYNAAQAAYRMRHRVHSETRPVPPLEAIPGRTELPLWVFRCDGPRQRLYVADRGDRVELFAGRQPIGEMSRTALGDAERQSDPWPLERDGWKLRPRALALSAFARLFLADLFIHGIGGAKYDEVTDEYVQGLLGLQPPPICCVSATVYLPLPRTGASGADVLAARRQSRDLTFNPQRYVQHAPANLVQERAGLIRRADELAAAHSPDRATRRAVFDEIHRVNEKLLAGDPWRAAEFAQRAQTLEERWKLDRIALDREYFAALHLKATLDELASRIRQALAPQ